MKNPFAILLAGAVLIGILITVVVFLVLGTSDDESDRSIQVASRSELPTPSTRNEKLVVEDARAFKGDSATKPTETPPSDSYDDESSTQPTKSPTETPQTSTSGNGQAAQGGDGPGDNRFQAIQEAMADNPEVAELFQKAQAGTITQEEQARMRELMQQLLAESGIEALGGQGGGFGAPPTVGTISYIFGSTLAIDLGDDSGSTTDVAVADDTNITIVEELSTADLTVDSDVVGTVQRGEGGLIFIVNLSVLSEQQASGFGGGFRGLGGAAGSATNISNVNGTISGIDGQTISVETSQGTLRLTANEESNIVTTSSGTVADLAEGMGIMAIGPIEDGVVQAANIVAGPEELIDQQGGIPRVGGARRNQ